MKMPFGRYEGREIEAVPMSYLWSLWEDNILYDSPLKDAIRQRIEPERYEVTPVIEATPSTTELKNLARQVLDRLNKTAQNAPD